MPKKILLNSKKIEIILNRLVCELVENHKDFNNTVLIGLQPRGVFLANKILEIFKKDYPDINISSGILDFTFFRDDFRRSEKTLSASTTRINFGSKIDTFKGDRVSVEWNDNINNNIIYIEN